MASVGARMAQLANVPVLDRDFGFTFDSVTIGEYAGQLESEEPEPSLTRLQAHGVGPD
jgi:hypothetical protein